MVNKHLSKQATDNKQQVKLLEEGFQRLQESFRGTVQEGLDAENKLRTRAKALQGIVDSLTGPPQEEDEDYDSDDSMMFELNARVHLPVRGRVKAKDPINKFTANNGALANPSSLVLRHRGKRLKKRAEACVHHAAKHVRKSRSTGTALMGRHRTQLTAAYQWGKTLLLPLFLDDDDDDGDSLSSSSEYDDSYDD